jgi:SHS2 domain-containing protein
VTYEWREHTAEVELAVEAASRAQVFEEAAEAFGRYVELDTGGEATSHRLELNGHDCGTLLVALLEELIYLADTEGFVADAARASIAGTRLTVDLVGRRTAVQPIVKAATYHNLTFEHAGAVWRARVVLDV